jgi:hypothetical protein
MILAIRANGFSLEKIPQASIKEPSKDRIVLTQKRTNRFLELVIIEKMIVCALPRQHQSLRSTRLVQGSSELVPWHALKAINGKIPGAIAFGSSEHMCE